MRKRVGLLLLLISLIFLILTGCSETYSDPAGRTYTYEKDGFGGKFSIAIHEDGTFSYYEGLLSSYLGMGEWVFADGVVTLTDNPEYELVNRFLFSDGDLIFIEEGSTGFLYVDVSDGETFYGE